MLHKDFDLKRLVTKEDKFHVHKILGALSLYSFVYRYGFCSPLIQYTAFDWATMGIHLALSLTALQFTVPKKRTKKPLIVYEEYRLHAIVFTSRCFFVYAFRHPFFVLVHHLAADWVTLVYGKEGDTAVRSIAVREGAHKYISMLFSLYQFLAIASHLFGPPSMAFNTLIAIQSSVFLMTLYKKKIIRGKTHLLVYSLCLLLSTYHMFLAMELKYLVLGSIAFLIRVSIPNNKYILWSCIYFVGLVV
jgi:hypothetical protein